MSIFRFYLVDLYCGEVLGISDEAVARDAAGCEDLFVIDTKTGLWLTSNGESRDILAYLGEAS